MDQPPAASRTASICTATACAVDLARSSGSPGAQSVSTPDGRPPTSTMIRRSPPVTVSAIGCAIEHARRGSSCRLARARARPRSRSGDGGERRPASAGSRGGRCAAGEAAREFLGDEVGGEPALAEARLRHQRREERHVVRHASDVELVERAAHALDGVDPRSARRCRAWRSSDRRTSRSRRPRRRRYRRGRPGRARARGSAPAGRSTAGSCGTDPRHRRAPRSPSRRASRPSAANGSFSPAATRIISSTRSRPVISSVTGCSTCSRVFISRK